MLLNKSKSLNYNINKDLVSEYDLPEEGIGGK
jgi:hypothetical protein